MGRINSSLDELGKHNGLIGGTKVEHVKPTQPFAAYVSRPRLAMACTVFERSVSVRATPEDGGGMCHEPEMPSDCQRRFSFGSGVPRHINFFSSIYLLMAAGDRVQTNADSELRARRSAKR